MFYEVNGTILEDITISDNTDKAIDDYTDEELKDIGVIRLPDNSSRYNDRKYDIDKHKKNKSKEDKIKSVSEIVVTTSSGKTFDGDENSQNRMMRALTVSGITHKKNMKWKLADNKIVNVRLEELEEALTLSVEMMSTIWLDV